MTKFNNVVLLAVGSFIAGILLAPKSGKETRQDLMNKRDEYKAKAEAGFAEVKKGAKDVKHEVEDGFDSVKGIAKDAAVDAKATAGRLKSEATLRGEAIKEKSQRTAEEIKRS